MKFGLEIEPLGHSDAMGEGRGGGEVLIMCSQYCIINFPLGLGGGGGDFGCFKLKVYLILPEALEYS